MKKSVFRGISLFLILSLLVGLSPAPVLASRPVYTAAPHPGNRPLHNSPSSPPPVPSPL
ncbi:MAG: hypothetical protein QHJ74_09680 [Anaerolineae bacterium]|nr:hypothetical protein [Anaerolineae bacterium]